MPSIEYNDITINVDDEGYLLNREEWDEKVACGLTQTIEDVDECDLTDERHVCKNVHQEKECLYEQFIDPIKAWKIAGLPKPTPDAIARIRHELD
jgi:tRNA 2-thiouridine synthesizing protein E